VNISTPAPINTLIPLTLLLRNHEIETTAVVVQRSAQVGGLHEVPGMGLQFTKISAEDLNLIREFIKTEVMRDLESRKA
jgi:hypothetical protein